MLCINKYIYMYIYIICNHHINHEIINPPNGWLTTTNNISFAGLASRSDPWHHHLPWNSQYVPSLALLAEMPWQHVARPDKTCGIFKSPWLDHKKPETRHFWDGLHGFLHGFPLCLCLSSHYDFFGIELSHFFCNGVCFPGILIIAKCFKERL